MDLIVPTMRKRRNTQWIKSVVRLNATSAVVTTDARRAQVGEYRPRMRKGHGEKGFRAARFGEVGIRGNRKAWVSKLIVASAVLAGCVAAPASVALSQAPETDGGESTTGVAPDGNADPGVLLQGEARRTEGEEAVAAAEREDGPSAAYREWSADAFTDLDANESAELMTRKFGEQLAAASADPAEPLREADSIRRFVSDNSALVDPPGPDRHALLVSNVPLRTEDGVVVDLGLARAGGQIAPKDPTTEVSIPDELADGAELESVDAAVQVEGATPSDENAVLLSTRGGVGDKEAAFYSETVQDTDFLIAPVPGGLELFAQMRSEESPESLTLNLEIPEGGRVVATAVGGAVVLDDSQQPVARIEPPLATDAQGADVPVSMAVDGERLVLGMAHRDREWAYPILVDPLIEQWNWYEYGGNPYSDGWTYHSNGWSNYVPMTQCVSPYDNIHWDCEGPRDWAGGGGGLYVYAPWHTWYPAYSSVWWRFTAPGSSSYISQAWVYQYRWWLTNGSVYPYGFHGLINSTGSAWVSQAQYLNPSSGSRFHAGNQTAKHALVGMHAGALNVTPTNYRYIRVGNIALWLDDQEAPLVGDPIASPPGSAEVEAETIGGTPTGPVLQGWFSDAAPPQVDMRVTDPGFGVTSMKLTIPQETGTPKQVSADPNPPCAATSTTTCAATRTDRFTLNTEGSRMPEGVNLAQFTAWDGLGKRTDKTVTVYLDRSGPDLATVSGGLFTPAEDGYDLHVTGKDGNRGNRLPDDRPNARSGVRRIDLFMDGSASPIATTGNQPCTDPWGSCSLQLHSSTFDPQSHTEGDHEFRLVGTDQLGNQASRDWTGIVENTPPTVASISGPATENWLGNETTTVTVQGEDAGAGVTKIELTLPGGQTASKSFSCSPTCPRNPTANFSVNAAQLPQGASTVTAQAFGPGLVAGGALSQELRVDHTPPSVSASGPGGWISDDSIPITVGADNETAGVEQIVLSLPNGQEMVETLTCSPDCPEQASHVFDVATAELPEGVGEATARAYAPGGSVGPPATGVLKIDRSAPTVTAVGDLYGPDALNAPGRARVSVAGGDVASGIQALKVVANASTDDPVTLATLSPIQLADGQQGCPGPNCSFTYELRLDVAELEGDEHTIDIEVKDLAGNVASVPTQEFAFTEQRAPILQRLRYTQCITGEADLGAAYCTETAKAVSGGSGSGLDNLADSAEDPDGRAIYAVSSDDAALNVFARDAESGEFVHDACITGESDTGAGGSGACAEVASGTPSGANSGLSGLGAVAVSPDGASVYVAARGDDAIGVFHLDDGEDETGELAYVGCISGELESGASGSGACELLPSASANGHESGLDQISDLAVSEDGAWVYAIAEGDDSVVTFGRDGGGGELAYSSCLSGEIESGPAGSGACVLVPSAATGGLKSGLDSLSAGALSPGGTTLYVSASGDDAIGLFERDPERGGLTFTGCVSGDSDAGVAGSGACTAVPNATPGGASSGLDHLGSLAASEAGDAVYGAAPADDALVTFDRDPSSGDFSYRACITGERESGPEGSGACAVVPGIAIDGGDSGLDSLASLSVSPDGTLIYGGAAGDDALVRFERSDPSEPPIYIDCVTGEAAAGSAGSAACEEVPPADETEGRSGLEGISSVVFGVDERAVYATAAGDDAIHGFEVMPTHQAQDVEIAYEDCISGAEDSAAVCETSPGATSEVAGQASGLGLTAWVVTVPDSETVLASSAMDSAITALDADGDGALEYAECLTGQTDVATSECEEAPGANVDGSESGLSSLSKITVSPDGRSAYALAPADDAIVSFSLDPSNAAVAFSGCTSGETGTGPTGSGACSQVPAASSDGAFSGLDAPSAAVVSPDGRFVYVASPADDAVSTFSRSPQTGQLSFVRCVTGQSQAGPAGSGACSTVPAVASTGDNSGLDGVSALAISPNGYSLYATSIADAAVVHLERSLQSGALTFAGCVSGDVEAGRAGAAPHCVYSPRAAWDGVDSGLHIPTSVAVSPDGYTVYVASTGDDSVTALDRDAEYGNLTYIECISGETESGPRGSGACREAPAAAKQGRNSGLDRPGEVAVSPTRTTVAVASLGDSAITLFTRDAYQGNLTYAGCLTGETGSSSGGSYACKATGSATKSGIGSGLGGVFSIAFGAGGNLYAGSTFDAAVAHLYLEPSS